GAAAWARAGAGGGGGGRVRGGARLTGAFAPGGGGTRARVKGDPRPAEGLVCFESGDRRLTARLVAGEFIKYQSRFGDEFGCRAELPALQVIEAVRRAAVVAERAGPVRLSFGPDQVGIEADAEGRARAAETVSAAYSGDQPVISFNPYYLLDGLSAAAAAAGAAESVGDAAVEMAANGAGMGRIRLEFNTPAKPALITWTADEERDGVPAFRYLLVPLRVPARG